MKYKIALTIVAALALASVANGASAIENLISIPTMPEPGGWSMILAGIALIGYVINRRSGNGGM